MALIQVSMMAQTLGRTVPVTVILPTDKMVFPGQPVREDKPYKTLYLLHGLTDNCSSWLCNKDPAFCRGQRSGRGDAFR